MTKTLKVILWGEEIGRLAWYGVSDKWTGRVETTIIDHLKAMVERFFFF